MNKLTPEIIRSSYDIDGEKVELLIDEKHSRFTIATRWANLAHLSYFPSKRGKLLALERASAVFEASCMNGAVREIAINAKKCAGRMFPSGFVNAAGLEKEVLRLTAKSAGGQS